VVWLVLCESSANVRLCFAHRGVPVARFMVSFSLGGFIFIVGYLLSAGSPNNYLTARSVFQSPLFTREECRQMLDLADQAAARNYDAALAIDIDLNMVIDPSTKQDRKCFGDLLDRRLAPCWTWRHQHQRTSQKRGSLRSRYLSK
jgi:hypothetical protein